MPVFTIDASNNITAHLELPTGSEGAFSTAKEFAKLTAGVAGFPPDRNLEQLRGRRALSGSEAGKEVHQPQGRRSPDLPGGRTAFPGDCGTCGDGRARQGEGQKKAPAKRKRPDTARPAAKEAGTNKKAEVIALMKRAKGVTLAEIMETTRWQAHTVRGFVSILGRKSDFKIESTKAEAGERTYRIAK